MTQTSQIQDQLDQLEARLPGLTDERDAAGRALAEARNAVVEGTGTTQKLIERQNAQSAVAGACEELQRRIEAKKQQLEAAHSADQRAARIEQLKETAAALTKDLEAMDTMAATLHGILNTGVSDLADLISALFENRLKFSSQSAGLGIESQLAAEIGLSSDLKQMLDAHFDPLGRITIRGHKSPPHGWALLPPLDRELGRRASESAREGVAEQQARLADADAKFRELHPQPEPQPVLQAPTLIEVPD
jgi:DNA repair exonuclease SbcCD ATPase subunit